MAIINVIRYRKYKSPVMSASKIVSLVSVMVSMLSLETAMFSSFGDGTSAMLRQIITASSGSVICIIVLVMAVWMIVNSTKEIREIKGALEDGR